MKATEQTTTDRPSLSLSEDWKQAARAECLLNLLHVRDTAGDFKTEVKKLSVYSNPPEVK